ncbi:cohesin domain-containing protein [Paenibacillus sp. HWE-109]|uniref:golvesin C-terminal-like domain-containing protein n=1 Tax=Paenibacillus sp. HWE-109 TaxID=1306526 RepID=UPI001EDCCD53|nr:Ig-like domain-containing protein [Paenibacillus sp. HWE-109]UKS24124.1 cohesin domain-containing protein [Paenibacillus sp. HWE-109]
MKAAQKLFKALLITALVFSWISSNIPTRAVYAASSTGEIIIDNGMPGYTESGEWVSSTLSGYNKTSTRYAASASNPFAQWTPDIAFPGNYDVYIYKVVNSTSDPNTRIDIAYSGGTDTQYMNNTVGSSGWVYLGKFPFVSGLNGSVKISSTTTGKYLRADAVKFVPDLQIALLQLQTLVSDASALLLGAVEGYSIGQYAPGSKSKLQEKVDNASSVLNSTNTSEGTVYSAIADLNAGVELFKSAMNVKDMPNSQTLKGELQTLVTEASALLPGAIEGASAGQYAPGSKLRLQENIDSAISVWNSTNATMDIIYSAIADLNASMAFFQSAMNAQISGSLYTAPNPNVNLVSPASILDRQQDLKNTLTRYVYSVADYVYGSVFGAVYGPPQGEISFKTDANWTDYTFPNQIFGNKKTTVQGEYYQYNSETPKGMTKLRVYRNAGVSVDNQAVVSIHHNGKTDTLALDMNTEKDGWYELGDYFFNGTSDEYVRFTRGGTDPTKPTVTLAVSYEVMRDKTYRDLNAAERATVYPVGYRETGTWQNSILKSDNTYSVPRITSEKNAVAVYNPGKLTAGKYEIFAYIPTRAQTGDNSMKMEVLHDGKIETMVFNQTEIDSGWFRLGEFTFSGVGNELVRMTKLSSGGETIASSVKFTTLQLDGVAIRNTIVTTNANETSVVSDNITIKDKVRAAQVTPGLTPNDNRNMIDNYKDAPYGKYYAKRDAFTGELKWNPVILEPGDYKVTYYIPPTAPAMPKNFNLDIYHNGVKDTVLVPKANLISNSWYNVGTFYFAAGAIDEYIAFKDMKYLSAFKFEKVSPGNAIIKEVVATTAKFFDDQQVDDVNNEKTAQIVNAMGAQGYLSGIISAYKFFPDQLITRSEFIALLTRLLQLPEEPAAATYSDITGTVPYMGNIGAAKRAGLLYGVDTTSGALGINLPVDRTFAAVTLSNAIDYTGRYLNVDNFFGDSPSAYLAQNVSDEALLPTYALQDAFYRLLKLGVMPKNTDTSVQPGKQLTRTDAIVMLNEFDGQLLSAGPDLRFDWHMMFSDEFNDSNFNWSKWYSDNANRFAGVSGRWPENIEQKDGVVKLKNEVNNRVGAPYSSASITSFYQQKFGYYESRYKYPDTYGHHTSYWTKNGPSSDYNWNEGTGQDQVSNNVWFLPEKAAPEYGLLKVRESLWSTNDNNFKELHNFAGYMEPPGFYMAYDNKITYDVPDFTSYLTPSSKYDVPYPNILSTAVTSFDGRLDLNKVDGTAAEFDWVRNYLKTASSDPVSPYPVYRPVVIPQDSVMVNNPDQPNKKDFVLRFNKQMNASTLTTDNLIVSKAGGGVVPSYTISQISPLRFKITFNGMLGNNSEYVVHVTTGVKDSLGNSLAVDQQVTLVNSSTADIIPQAVLTGPTAVLPGASFMTNLGLNNLTDDVFSAVYAADITVKFDANALDFVSVEPLKSGFTALQTKTDVPGQIRIIAVSQGATGALTTSGDVFKFNWIAKPLKQSLTTNLELAKVTVANALGQKKESLLTNLMVSVTVSMPGDVNGDNVIDVGDLGKIAANYGKTLANADWNQVSGCDFNHDGKINIVDLVGIARLILQ